MKQIFGVIAFLALFAGLGLWMTHSTTCNTVARTDVKKPAERPDQLAPAVDAEGNYPYVNQARLTALAQNKRYKGPSFRVEEHEVREMIASRQMQKERVPASEKKDAQ